MSTKLKENFSKSSLSHMLAISGTHIGYIVMLITTIMKKYKNKQRFFIIIILIIYMNMIGFTPSVMRACLMNIIYFISKLLKRNNDAINSICISIILILISNPFNLFDIGLLLSYGGTIGIIFFYDKIQKFLNQKIKIENKFVSYIINSVALSTAAQIVIFPIMISIFGNISFNFFIFNILAGPVLGAVIFSGIILIILPFGISSFIVKTFIQLLITITNLSNIIPLSKIFISIPSIYSIILIYIGIILFFKRYNLKFIAGIVILILCIETLPTLSNKMKIYFVDVGQGDCTVVKTIEGKTILVDAGGGMDNTEYDIGKNVVLPYLLNRKISKIDYMMISHFDADHCNGTEYILKNIKVNNLIISRQAKITNEYTNIIDIAKKKKVRIIYVKNKDRIKIDKKTYFEIYHPENELIGDDINENSIVAKLVYKAKIKEVSILFTGDIELDAEASIVRRKPNLKADILKVGHHGSKTSSTEEFLKLVNPKIALIGVGRDNNFGHPNEDVISRLEGIGAKIYRTDLDGEIKLEIDRDGIIKIEKML